MFSFNPLDGSIHSKTHSDPISFYPYVGSSKYKVESSWKWDFWAFGVTKELMLQGSAFTFPNQVGFIFNTSQNRITQLMFPGTSIVLDPGNQFDLVKVLASSYGTFATNFGDVSGIV